MSTNDAYVLELLEKAPRLSEVQRDRLRVLLHPTGQRADTDYGSAAEGDKR